MARALRNTGISVIGDMPWGTHLCHFYETKQDLLDTLVPYFKAGLESKEFCLWVVSNSEFITVSEAKAALEQAVPDLDRHLSDENIEILDGRAWYLAENVFVLERVTKAWDAKLDRALARGYEGMRVSGDTLWLDEKHRKDFFTYDKKVNASITGRPMTVLCTYPLAKSRAVEILDVVEIHQFAITRRRGKWKIIETPELTQAKAEIERLNEGLEQRVVERTIELRESEERFRQLAENIREVFWMTTTDLNNILYISPAIEAIWGRSRESLYREPRSFFTAIHPDDRSPVMAIMERDRELGFEVEYRVMRPDGSIRWIWDRGFPVTDESGRFYRIAGIAEDITERKQAEEKLKQSERRLAEAQRVAHVGYWDRNINTGEIIWSDETYRIFGLQPQEPIENFEELIHLEDRPVQAEATVRALRGEHYDVEYRVVRPDGEVRLVHSQGNAILDESGRPRGAFGTVQDVTELKRAEAELKAISEQLRALSANLESAREDEATRIARELHDELGATLSILKWDLEDVVEVISESTDPSQLAVLRKRIGGMIELTDTTLNAVRRIVSELRPIVLDELGLGEAIEWQLQQFQSRTGITCRCECSVEGLDLKREQSTGVFRIVQEALTNILRHSQATEVDITMKENGRELVLTIRDNGRGITERRKSGALSLGLLGMRERAHLIGGQIDIRGTEGQGTVIVLRIPFGPTEQMSDTL